MEDVVRENFLSVHQSTLWHSYHQSKLVANRDDLGEGNGGFCLRNISVFLLELFYMPQCLTTWDLRLYFLSAANVC
jgi:hypothetical protein